MLRKVYQSFLDDSLFKKNIFIVITLLVIISNVFLAIKIFSIETGEKTIIHPVNLFTEYSIDKDNADPEYIGKLAEEFLRARLLYTPKTVVTQFDNITKYFHPSIYGDKKSELDAEAARIIRTDETSVFFPMSTHIKKLTAYVESEVIGYLGKKQVTQDVRFYEVQFRNSGGRLWLFKWQEVIPDSTGKSYIPVNKGFENTVSGER